MEVVKITDYMSVDLINLDLQSKNKAQVLKELLSVIAKSPNIVDSEKCYEALITREKMGSTGIGKSVAIPHAKTEYSENLTIGFGINKDGIDFDSLDSEKAKIFFIFASPIKDSQIYLKILARISRLIRNEAFRTSLLKAKSPEEIIELINKEEALQ
ncbi:MAG: PTS sugar transporter subunit IIA [Fusobacteria bacterium]|jgi:fructose-specific phosphotransferase system IIA component|nr:PTS sugar transporter subunit IIA [Fusobacteriota bacterium]